MSDTERTQLHASCVALTQGALLLLGPSGAGKSDIAIRLIDCGAKLVADDRVDIVLKDNQLLASAPQAIAGKLEVRGVGIMELPYSHSMPIKLAVNLTEATKIERLPEAQFFDCLGQKVPLLSLHAFEESSCAKIRLFLQYGI